ncbi:hypothetical protein TSUD_02400 [Trifolium subterraneum]|uniref:Secreted protein n=1 Tax=Trifolium subterraneum TaxID=3900 RepID=A0A2Z6M660_TRISU|nr:hypothetical protein TSUD_02400 [Trifolium subterraneum]
MSMSKALFASLLISLVILHLVESDRMIVMVLAMEGASYLQDQRFAREHVEHVVIDAIVCLQELLLIWKSVLAMPI